MTLDIRPCDVVAASADHETLPLPACFGKVECEWVVAAMCRSLAEAGHGWNDPVTLAEARHHLLDGNENIAAVRAYFACAARHGWVISFDMNTYVLTRATCERLAEYEPVQKALRERLEKENQNG